MDAVFLVSLFVIGLIFDAINRNVSIQQISQFVFLSIVYYLILLFIYSLFKYIVLFFVNSSFKENKIDFNKLGKFYLLNIIIFLILFFVFFILSALASSVRVGIAPFASLLILLIFSLFAYAFINIIHVLFKEGKNISESLKFGIKFLGKLRSYYGVYLVIIITLGFIFLLFGFFGNILKLTAFQEYDNLLRYGNLYQITFVHSVGILFYISILFNRFYFYNIIKEKFSSL